MDIGGAVLLLVIAAIPMLIIASLIRREDGGPALFRQTRVGKNLQPFSIFKFRTMTVNPASAVPPAETAPGASSEQSDAFRTIPGDPRITRIGKFLRPSHLDELPQLLNILRGEMSFIGVRPDTFFQEGDYPPDYWVERHRYLPGLAGPAQLRSDPMDFAQRQEEELRWLRHRSIGMYVRVLLRTAVKALRRNSF